MRVSIITLFPEFFESPLKTSLLGKALQDQKIDCQFVHLRNYGEGKYKAVDDRPFGGGPGMVLMPDVLERALQSTLPSSLSLEDIQADVLRHKKNPAQIQTNTDFPYVIALSPQGKVYTSTRAKELSKFQNLILICGHYEGFDDRFIDTYVHEELSIGDYVLTGGEAGALVVLEAMCRFIPGVIGDFESVNSDTFETSTEMIEGGLKAPQYTRPASWKGKGIPKVLLSGHHADIRQWRLTESYKRTRARRPDLLEKAKIPTSLQRIIDEE